MIDKIKSLINDGEQFTGFIVDFDDSNDIASSQWLSEIEIFNEAYLKKHPLYNRIHRLCFHKKNDKTCTEMMGVLKALEKEFSTEETNMTYENSTKNSLPKVKAKKIFISHASADKAYMELLVELLEFMGLDGSNLICTSVTGFGIPLGRPIYDFLRDSFNDYELHVIFAHSHNFYSRPVCLNEMGAAWVAKTKHTSILLPNFSYSEMTGVVDNKNLAIKLDDERTEVCHRLDELYEMIATDFNLKKVVSTRWEQKRNSFLERVLSVSNATKKTSVLDGSKVTAYYEQEEKQKQIDSDVLELLKMANRSSSQKNIIVKQTDILGYHLNAGDETLNTSDKETARWEYAIEKAIELGVIKPSDAQGKTFKITHKGYEFLEE